MHPHLDSNRVGRYFSIVVTGSVILLLSVLQLAAQNYPKDSKIDIDHPISVLPSRQLLSELKSWYALFRHLEQTEPPDSVNGIAAAHGLWLDNYSADYVTVRDILTELDKRRFPRTKTAQVLQQAVDASGQSKTSAMKQLLSIYGVK